jgi:hypothetical protein
MLQFVIGTEATRNETGQGVTALDGVYKVLMCLSTIRRGIIVLRPEEVMLPSIISM